MIIAKGAIQSFLARDLRDSGKAKRFSEQALDRKIAHLVPRPQFHTKPRLHQKVCFLLGVKYPQYLLLLEMGLGKSKCVLDLTRYWQKRKAVRQGLVLVPNYTNIQQWVDEVRIHTPGLSIAGLDGATREDRLDAIDSGADLIVCTYMGWLSLVCEHKAGKPKLDKDENKVMGKGSMKLSPKLFKKYGKRFDAVIFDEITAASNPQSLTFRACNQLSRQCDVRYGLTGTPFGGDPTNLWAEFYLIDRGETLGETLGIFRAAFFTAKKSFWHQGHEYTFDKRKRKLLHRVIRHRSIRYSEAECNDLPERIEQTARVIFPAETWRYYEKVIQEIRKAEGNVHLLENAYMRARQMCSGWASAKGEDGTKINVKFGQNPKLDLLLQKIAEMPKNRKAIIFHELINSGQLICDALKKSKVGHVWLHGKASGKAKIIDRFKNDPKVRVIVSSTAGALGGNWQIANYTMFFELPNSAITYRQMVKRNHRQGQTRTVFLTHLVVKGSIEQKMLAHLKAGKSLFDSLVDGKVLL